MSDESAAQSNKQDFARELTIDAIRQRRNQFDDMAESIYRVNRVVVLEFDSDRPDFVSIYKTREGVRDDIVRHFPLPLCAAEEIASAVHDIADKYLKIYNVELKRLLD